MWITEWLGKPIPFELHHADDCLDNRLENLSFLCPNCHRQTDSWGGRNRARATLRSYALNAEIDRSITPDVVLQLSGGAAPTITDAARRPSARHAISM